MVMHKKVAVLLSGGVDSSVTAFLLKKQGYEVVAVTGKMFCSPETEQIVTNAKNVANSLGIEHFVCDVSEDFKTQIIDYFENSYKIGQTPNPCIMCNKKIKSVAFKNFFRELVNLQEIFLNLTKYRFFVKIQTEKLFGFGERI